MSVLVGTSEYTYMFTLRRGDPPLVDRWVGGLPLGLGLEGALKPKMPPGGGGV